MKMCLFRELKSKDSLPGRREARHERSGHEVVFNQQKHKLGRILTALCNTPALG